MRQLKRRRPNHSAEGAGHNLAEQQVAGRQKQQISTDVYGHGGGQTIEQKGHEGTLQSREGQAGRSCTTAVDAASDTHSKTGSGWARWSWSGPDDDDDDDHDDDRT